MVMPRGKFYDKEERCQVGLKETGIVYGNMDEDGNHLWLKNSLEASEPSSKEK